jgi:hypothetical protein
LYRILNNIPASLLAGMLFFCAQAQAQQLELTRALFAKGEYSQCRSESKRALLTGTEPIEHFELLHALAGTQLQRPTDETLQSLQQLVQQNRNPQISAMAAYELGRTLWQIDRPAEALDAFVFTFQTTTDKSLFLHAACSAFLLMNQHPALKAAHPDWVDQINTSRSQWYGSLFGECSQPQPSEKTQPNWLVRFYRAQISPAIGNRCTLEPSCSEYFNQAWQKHGPTAIPMIGDRLCREPGVNDRQQNPILKNGQIRYGDPIKDHDFWMEK